MHLPAWLTRLRLRTLLLTGLGITALLTLLFYLIVMEIELEFPLTEPLPPIDSASLAKPAVHVGVISRYPPTIMFRGYQPIMDYLTAHTPYRFELLLGRDYNEALEHLIAHRVTAVFLGSYLYVRAHELYGVIPVLKPLNENRQPLSRSALIVRENSSIRSVNDLAGRTLALPSTESFSANWTADDLLRRAGMSLADLGRVQNFSHHHTVIAQVLNGTFDAGVTRELLLRDAPGSGLRIVALSDPIPSSPLAVLPVHDTLIVRAMRDALLAVNRDESIRPLLTRGWDAEFVNGFVDATDADYEVVRRIARPPVGGRATR